MATIDINKLYLYLLDIYSNKSNEEFIKERKRIADLVKNEKIEFKQEGFIPYPQYDDTEFNKKIFAKKEFNRNKTIFDISDFDKVSNNECAQNAFILTPNQRFIKGFLSPLTPYNSLLLFHGVGVGKCHAKDTLILMYDGSIEMVQNIKIGDKIMGDDSTLRTIISLAKGQDYMYNIIPIKGESFNVNSEHILCLKFTYIIRNNVNFIIEILDKYTYKLKIKSFKIKKAAEDYLKKITEEDQIIEISVKRYLELSNKIKKNLKLYRKGVEYKDSYDVFEPYLIGFWLGNGFCDSIITIKDLKVVLYLQNIAKKHNLNINYQGGYNYKISSIKPDKNIFLETLKKYNLINNKHISREYLINSKNVRLNLLAGIIDSDGYLYSNYFKIIQNNFDLVKDIVFLARSLGFAAYFKLIYKSKYIISIYGKNLDDIPTKKLIIKFKEIKDVLVTSFMIKESGYNNYYGFIIDKNNRYLLGDFTVTHNTCTAISIAEQYHDIYQKKILVILSSSLVDNFKKQIFDISKYDIKNNIDNLCTGTTYPDMIMDKQKLDKETLEKKINKLINEKYQFIGYKELAILMDKIRSKIQDNEIDPIKIEKKFNERLSEIFSDRMVIIDEAHNLRNPSETGKKQISTAFKTLLKHVVNVKLVLLTATPMFNNAKEIVWTLNLLLTNDKRPELTNSLLFDKQNNLTDKGRQLLYDTSRGYVSYMRGENPFSFPFRLFPSINNDTNLLKTYSKNDVYGKKITKENQIKYLEIIVSNMSSYQKEIYDSMKKKIVIDIDEDIEDEDIEEELNINNDLQNTMQISNIVYPSITKDIKDTKKLYGSQGFDTCFRTNDKGKISYKSNISQFLSYDKIDEFAPKIKSILDYIIKSKGIVFIYSRYYASGIIPLAIALEHIGFEKYGTSNITQNITVTDKFEGKRPKYIVLSRKKELSPNNDNEITASKSINNKDGNIIKVIIVSKIGTEGIDFKRIREIHLLEPWFNLNRAEQIIGRGVRYCSHIDLPKAERNVTIMFHASIYDENEESVDLRTYRIAESKQKRILEIEHILKESSIDCNLNKKTSIFPIKKLNMEFDIMTSQGNLIKSYQVGDRDYSHICGFTKCKSICNPDIPDNIIIDDTTFDSRFISDDINLYKKYIAKLYKKTHYYSYKKILKELQEEYNIIEEEIILFALDDMINSKFIIFDKFGRNGYLIYRSKQYIFQYVRMSDLRMTIAEREEEIYNRRNLPLKELHQKKIIDTTAAANAANATATAANATATAATELIKNKISPVKNDKILINNILIDYHKIHDLIYRIIIDSFVSSFSKTQISELLSISSLDNNIIKYIKDTINEVPSTKFKPSEATKNILTKMQGMIETFDNSIIDSIIDRLNTETYPALIQLLAIKYNKDKKSLNDIESKCLKSLVLASVVIMQNDNIKYFYNHFDNDIYCLKSNEIFKKCNPIDLVKINEYYSLITTKKTIGLQDKTIGYIAIKPINKNIIEFKIKDSAKKKGYVCYKTSSFVVDDLKKRMNQIAPGIIPQTAIIKHTKIDLCYIFEILQRTFQSELFQRPHFI